MKLNKEILRLAGPSILANITVPLVGMADIAVAGHLADGGGAAALIGGISLGTMLFDLLYWNFAFLRTGTVGLTAQAYGAGSPVLAILRRALRIALLSGLALIALQWAVVWLSFKLVVCSPQVQALATQYFHIRIWAAPATLSLFAFKGWFVGLQDTVRPMTADLLVNGLNILLSVGLGFGLCGLPRLGFAGVAVGTVAAQWCGFAYAALAAGRKITWRGSDCKSDTYKMFSSPASVENIRQNTDTEQLTHQPVMKTTGREGTFWRLNRDLVLRSVGMIAVYIGFTVISARYGDLVLAVSTILMKLLMLLSYFTDGFAFAGEALTGRFIGAGDRDGLRSTVRGTFLWGAALAAAFMLLYGLGGVPLLRLMTSDPEVVSFGRQFLPWLLVMPLVGTPAFVWDGIFIGATEGAHLRNSTLLCAVGFFAVWFAGTALLHAQDAMALHVLMAAYFTHLLVRSAYLTGAYFRKYFQPMTGSVKASTQATVQKSDTGRKL